MLKSSSGGPICAICAQNGPTCCQLGQEQTGILFPISAVEKDIISDSGRWKSGNFIDRAPNSSRFISHLKYLFPNDQKKIRNIFPQHGHHECLLTDKKGHCIFLGPTGCLLPNEARPLYCRLFPFWVIDGRVAHFHFDLCQAQKGDKPVKDIIMSLKANAPGIISLYKTLRRAWLLDG